MHLLHPVSAPDFTTQAVRWLGEHINQAIDDHDFALIGLSGGSTPKPVYTELGKRTDIDWTRVKIFLLDERYTDASNPDSNQQMIRETLLAHASIPEAHIAFPDTRLPVNQCVARYAEDLRTLWEDRLPDITVIGMGDDGHIASLFPPVPAEALDDRHLVLHTQTPLRSDGTPRFAIHDRITLTLNPIASAGSHLIILQGDAKKRAWEEMLKSAEGVERWPMKRIVEGENVTVLIG